MGVSTLSVFSKPVNTAAARASYYPVSWKNTLDEALVIGFSNARGLEDVMGEELCGLRVLFRGGGRWGRVIFVWRRSRVHGEAL